MIGTEGELKPTLCAVFSSESRWANTFIVLSQVITGTSIVTDIRILRANIHS